MRKLPIILCFGFIFLLACKESPQKQEDDKNEVSETKQEENKNKSLAAVNTEKKEYGFSLDDYKIVRDTVKSGDSFGNIMRKHGVSPGKVYRINKKVKDSFNTTKITLGKPYAVLESKTHPDSVGAFVYQNDRIHYTVLDLGDTIAVHKKKYPVKTKRRKASGVIETSFSNALDDAGLDRALANELVNLYQWKINFFHIKKGDSFKIIFDEKYIKDSIYAGIADIKAAEFTHNKKPYYAFHYEDGPDDEDKFAQFYDDEGKSLQNFFLKAPVKYTRISSRYSKSRYHPVQHYTKAHLGTDFAAPTGTPIKTTADGVVTIAGHTSGNGNYVKVKHNRKYTTQYLHMSKRNVKKGEHVEQGDVIGYVGQTGLATGPHVCYRFWVNGKQVDPFEQDMPDSEPLPDSLEADFQEKMRPIKAELDEMDPEQAKKKMQLANSISLN